MRRLSATDLQRVHDVLPLVYSDADEERFSGVAVEVVGRVLPHDVVSYNEIDVVRRQVRGLADPAETIWSADAPAIFDSHFDEHPSIRAVARSGDGAPRRISDALSTLEFHRLGLYAEFYRQIGVEHQLSTTLAQGPGWMVAVSADRGHGRDFSDRDVAVLDALRPHLAAAYRKARAATTWGPMGAVLDALGEAVLVCTMTGRPRVVSERAAALFALHLGWDRRGRLPEVVARWLSATALGLGKRDDVAAVVRPLVIAGPTGRLLLHASVAGDGGCFVVRARAHGDVAPVADLSPREREVLDRAAEGLSDMEIARQLSISARTVGKHLERAYRKLGVSSRGRAVRAVRDGAAWTGTGTSHADG
jgi:DNA-binding CsgD family transcriptional regulator/PAS domain-containing protein